MVLAKRTLGIRRNLKEEKRRKQIKQAAVNVFSTKGYDQAPLDDVFLEAGVSKSLLYWYWENKAALLCELIDDCMAPYLELIQEAVKSEESFSKKFNRFLWDFLELARRNEKLNKLVHFCSLHHKKTEKEDFGKRINAYYQKILLNIESLFQQGVDNGYLRKDLDIEAFSLGLLSFVEGHIYMSILQERMPLDRILTILIKEFMISR